MTTYEIPPRERDKRRAPVSVTTNFINNTVVLTRSVRVDDVVTRRRQGGVEEGGD